MDKEPLGSVFLLASITNSSHHPPLLNLSHRLACLLCVPSSLYSDSLQKLTELRGPRVTQVRPNIILPMSLRLWSLDPVTMFLYV